MVKARLAPLMTVVFWVSLLLPALLSLSAVKAIDELIVAGPGPRARQVKVTLRTSRPEPPTVPRLHCTTVADTGAQLAPAGLAETKVAPAGTVRVRRTLLAASAALLSTRAT